MPRRFARENFTSGRRRRPISSSMLKVPNKGFATLKNVVNIFFPEVRPDVVRDISISRDQLELISYLRKKEIPFFGRPSVSSYLSLAS